MINISDASVSYGREGLTSAGSQRLLCGSDNSTTFSVGCTGGCDEDRVVILVGVGTGATFSGCV